MQQPRAPSCSAAVKAYWYPAAMVRAGVPGASVFAIGEGTKNSDGPGSAGRDPVPFGGAGSVCRIAIRGEPARARRPSQTIASPSELRPPRIPTTRSAVSITRSFSAACRAMESVSTGRNSILLQAFDATHSTSGGRSPPGFLRVSAAGTGCPSRGYAPRLAARSARRAVHKGLCRQGKDRAGRENRSGRPARTRQHA